MKRWLRGYRGKMSAIKRVAHRFTHHDNVPSPIDEKIWMDWHDRASTSITTEYLKKSKKGTWKMKKYFYWSTRVYGFQIKPMIFSGNFSSLHTVGMLVTEESNRLVLYYVKIFHSLRSMKTQKRSLETVFTVSCQNLDWWYHDHFRSRYTKTNQKKLYNSINYIWGWVRLHRATFYY